MHSKINPAKYLYVVLMFLWCSGTSPYLKIAAAEVPYFMVVHGIVLFVYFNAYCRPVRLKPLVTIYSLFGLWWAMQCVKNESIVGIDVGILTNTLAAYIAFNIFKGREYFYYFERVLTHLVLLSLVVWGTSLVNRGLMESIFDRIDFFKNSSTCYGSIGLVGLGNQKALGMTITRNIGFTWEAGRFSGFIVAGIFVNIMLHGVCRLSPADNKSLWVLLLGLLSTFSTTGYGAVLAVVLYYIYNRTGFRRVMLATMMAFTIPAIWGLSFFGEKIMNEMDITQQMLNVENTMRYTGMGVTPGRVIGAYIEWENFIHDFWLGYNENEMSYANTAIFSSSDLWLSNGWIQVLAKYGILLSGFLYYQMIRSSTMISEQFGMKGGLFFALLFVLISISYDYWPSCVMLYFVFYRLFTRQTAPRRHPYMTYDSNPAQ